MAGPSKRDREKLRSRVKTELRKLGRSQKDLETSLGLTSGTLTRVFGGRRKLDQELAEGIATELNSTIEELFKATAYLKVLDTSGDAAKPAPKPAAAKPAPKPAAAKPAPKPAAAKPAPKPAAKAAPEPATAKPVPKPAAAKAAPKPVAAEPAPAPAPRAADPVRPSPPPPEEPRFRKRDVPLKVARFVLGWVFGD